MFNKMTLSEWKMLNFQDSSNKDMIISVITEIETCLKMVFDYFHCYYYYLFHSYFITFIIIFIIINIIRINY